MKEIILSTVIQGFVCGPKKTDNVLLSNMAFKCSCNTTLARTPWQLS